MGQGLVLGFLPSSPSSKGFLYMGAPAFVEARDILAPKWEGEVPKGGVGDTAIHSQNASIVFL